MKVGLNTFQLAARFGFNEQGISSETNLLDSARFTAKWGVEVIELMLDISIFAPEQMSEKIAQGLRDLSQQTGVKYSAHLPYTYVDISCLNESFRLKSLHFLKSAISFAKKIGADTNVLHPLGKETAIIFENEKTGNSRITQQRLLDRFLDAIARSLDQLIQYVPSHKLCIENIEYFPFNVIDRILSQFDVCICLDVGHAVHRNEDPIRLFEIYRERIRIIHLHDTVPFRRPNGKETLVGHQPPRGQTLPVERFIRRLQDHNWEGYLILEPLSTANARESLDIVRHLGLLPTP